MEVSINPTERRRAPRIPAEILVMIEGLHDDYSLARGDISSSGLLVELPAAPGSPGDLELLHIATTDREQRVAVMGQIVRCVTIDTIGDELPMVAVVFHFLPERPEVRTALGRLLSHVLEQNRARDDFAIEHAFDIQMEPAVELEPSTPRAATVFRLQVKQMRLETTWPVSVGDRVQLSFRTNNAKLPFEGQITKVSPRQSPTGPRYDVEVAVGELGERNSAPLGSSFSDSLDLVLNELIASDPPISPTNQRHLAGRLNRIPLSSLLTFLEMERQTGRLTIGDEDTSTMFIDHGQIVDVAPFDEDPRAQIESLLAMSEGRFAFTCEPVDRTDRIQLSVTHILLDWARREDEEGR